MSITEFKFSTEVKAIDISYAINKNYGYIMNYDVPLSILTQINEYQKKLNDYDVVHFNYEEEDYIIKSRSKAFSLTMAIEWKGRIKLKK